MGSDFVQQLHFLAAMGAWAQGGPDGPSRLASGPLRCSRQPATSEIPKCKPLGMRAFSTCREWCAAMWHNWGLPQANAFFFSKKNRCTLENPAIFCFYLWVLVSCSIFYDAFFTKCEQGLQFNFVDFTRITSFFPPNHWWTFFWRDMQMRRHMKFGFFFSSRYAGSFGS